VMIFLQQGRYLYRCVPFVRSYFTLSERPVKGIASILRRFRNMVAFLIKDLAHQSRKGEHVPGLLAGLRKMGCTTDMKAVIESAGSIAVAGNDSGVSNVLGTFAFFNAEFAERTEWPYFEPEGQGRDILEHLCRTSLCRCQLNLGLGYGKLRGCSESRDLIHGRVRVERVHAGHD